MSFLDQILVYTCCITKLRMHTIDKLVVWQPFRKFCSFKHPWKFSQISQIFHFAEDLTSFDVHRQLRSNSENFLCASFSFLLQHPHIFTEICGASVLVSAKSTVVSEKHERNPWEDFTKQCESEEWKICIERCWRAFSALCSHHAEWPINTSFLLDFFYHFDDAVFKVG